MSTNRDDILKQFCDVTGTDEDRSKFFLESSNWQLEVALSSFFEHGGNVEDNNMPSLDSHPAPEARIHTSSDTDSPPPSPVNRKKKNKNVKNTNKPKFATLSSLQNDSSSDEDEGEAFYAGGSVRSGQQILGPKKNKDIVSEVFKSVKDQGAVAVEDEPATSRGHSSMFSGTGYRLGQTPDDHEEVATGGGQSQENVRAVRLRLYREGFTVDSGPLRSYSEPENAEFINNIRRGEVPAELSASGMQVRVSLEDRRHEECPKQSQVRTSAFAGKGHMLGSPTPATVGGTDVEPTTPDREANQRAAQTAVNVDDSLPTTTIQFRLADGSRLSGRFNHTHTVGDLRQYLTTASPSAQLYNFVLMTTFPSAELSDPIVTLEQAKLLNSVIVQRIK